MRVTLSEEAHRYLGRFDELTGVAARDCLVDDDRLTFLVPPDAMSTAIGPGGRTVDRLEAAFGRDVELVADADTPEAFVANALSPAAVRGVTASEQSGRIAYVEVEPADRGVAIGEDGRRIDRARRLAARHYDIDEVQLT